MDRALDDVIDLACRQPVDRRIEVLDEHDFRRIDLVKVDITSGDQFVVGARWPQGCKHNWSVAHHRPIEADRKSIRLCL